MFTSILSSTSKSRPRDQEILSALDSILASTAFAGSARSKDFLKFVVTESLAGRVAEIKERTIAIEVFGRAADYDPAHDSIVRVKALEVRKRLAQYYRQEPAAPFRIELPSGRYVPTFQTQKSATRRPAWLPAAAAATLAIAALSTALLLWPASGPGKAHEALWDPAIRAGVPVLISLPAPLIWDAGIGDELPGATSIPMEKLGRKSNYYVGVGAAFGAAQFASLLTARRVPFVLKIGPEVSLEDLRSQPAILLGAFTSEWTMRLTSGLRYTFVQQAGRHGIIDKENPSRGWYQPRLLHSDEMTDALAMVVRLSPAETGRPVYMAAGCTAHGTQTAVEFLTNPALFQEFADAAPAGWENQNLQVVLRADVHRGRAGRPEILAIRVWSGPPGTSTAWDRPSASP